MVTPKRTVLIVEDDKLFGSLLVAMLSQAGFVPRLAENVTHARAELKSFDPDIALLDINLGEGPSGIQLGHSISLTHPGVGIVFLTRYHDLTASGINRNQLPAGCAVVGKERLSDSSELLAAIDSVLSTKAVPIRHDQGEASELGKLTTNQRQILHLVAAGWTNAAIAHSRAITPRSVERTLQSLAKTLSISSSGDLNTRIELTRRYLQHTGFEPGP